MSECARCSVARLMNRQGKLQTIELEAKIGGYAAYEIWIEIHPRKTTIDRGDPRCIVYQDRIFLWSQTVFATQHSLDSDCSAYGRDKIFTSKDGFPTRLEWEDVNLVKYSYYLGID